MIEYIDVQNFGCFKNFVWNTAVRDDEGNVKKFKKLNVIYGRNYSGKTTLSRIFRCLHTGKFPEKYDTPSFNVVTNTGTINHNQIPTSNHNIRVYNKDYVNDHLSFLRDHDGKITPFAIIGSENKTIENEIAENEKKLGSVEEKSGLRHQYATKYADFTTKQRDKNNAETALKTKLTNKATKSPIGIKHNPIYKDPNYNTPKIQTDIKKIRSQSFKVLDRKERKLKEALLDEVPLPDIENKIKYTANIANLHATAQGLLEKAITPTKPIQELLDDAILQAWVKQGIPQHRDKRKNCGFCGQTIPEGLWKKLDEHFSKESSDLEDLLQTAINSINKEREGIKSIITIESKDFYSTFQAQFEDAKKALEDEVAQYILTLDRIIKSLQHRIGDIFTPEKIAPLTDNTSDITEKITTLNRLIDQNNQKTKSLASDQEVARDELRLSEIALFIQEIDLPGEEKKIADLQAVTDKAKEQASNLQADIKTLEGKIESLRIQLKDEKKGAKKVNEYLNHYFGHDGLHLEAVEDKETSAYKFQIMRGSKPAYNLSEGECSLVSFCYFIAKLEDTKSKGKNLVIFIDDPISSLDTNHIFFVYSLIDSFIAKPEIDSNGKKVYRYEQLFISTHNLDFLKYLKRLKRPGKDLEQFVVIGKAEGSTLELMPSYLKDYITEFNYLFDEIYACVDPANATSKHHCFYNFGNNLRKFLEAFLFFKYPSSVDGQGDYNARIERFFGTDPNAATLVQRLTNEFSHLGESFDRSVKPLDHAEISKLAKFVLRKIKSNDSDQFECLLKSIGKPDPLVTETL
jgi:wobble nucleotide-excising tRNase